MRNHSQSQRDTGSQYPDKNSFLRSGFVAIDKPMGLSSAVVVGRVKRALGAAKVGHGGTLDPDATGLLLCLVNGATRIAPYILEGRKVYEGTFRFGVTTSTDDMAGEVLTSSEVVPDEEAVQGALQYFIGTIQQVPPRVSAIQIDGRRAYDLERKGRDFELSARPVNVYSFSLSRESSSVYRYRVECGPGTYVRSIARDLGAMLGCGGAVETLRRVASGVVEIGSGINLEEVRDTSVRDWPALLPHLPVVEVPLQLAKDLLQGRESALFQVQTFLTATEGDVVIYRSEGGNESCGMLSRTEGGWRYLVSAMAQFGLGR